jgi:hypothetical protein
MKMLRPIQVGDRSRTDGDSMARSIITMTHARGGKKVAVNNLIAFQGIPGAYSEIACKAKYPLLDVLPCTQFDDAFAAVKEGRARLAMIPVDNSLAGRIADIHHILPRSRLQIVGEHFVTGEPSSARDTRREPQNGQESRTN